MSGIEGRTLNNEPFALMEDSAALAFFAFFRNRARETAV
jgi:hypothetical protein